MSPYIKKQQKYSGLTSNLLLYSVTGLAFIQFSNIQRLTYSSTGNSKLWPVLNSIYFVQHQECFHTKKGSFQKFCLQKKKQFNFLTNQQKNDVDKQK